MTALRTVELADARRLAIVKQRLAGKALRSSPAKVLDVARSIRCVQLDPISVVARSPLLVLRSRLPSFRPAHLERLVYRDRSMFEYWAHAASIVLTEDLPIHRYQMRNYPWVTTPWGRKTARWMEQNAKLRRSILADLRRRGPLRIKDLTDHAVVSWESTGWTQERNVDQMTRFLWAQGKVLVADRRGLDKWWDLAERVLPNDAPTERLRDRDVTRRAAELSLHALGIATARHITQHFTVDLYPELPKVLDGFERQGVVERVEVRDDGTTLKGPWFVHRDDLSLLEKIERGWWAPRTTLLSPFDNLIYDRKRARVLFGLDYTMEIYVPKEKRRYGYYAMPLLDGDRFVARIDAARDRAGDRLVVHAAHPEDGVRATSANAEPVRQAVEELAAWLGAERIDVDGRVPAPWRRGLDGGVRVRSRA
jgi:uncharacterized protein YcaQ